MVLYKSLLPLAFLTTKGFAEFSGCVPDGPLLPRPNNLKHSIVLQGATSQLQDTLNRAVKQEIEAGWSLENTSFSIGLVSSDSPSGKPIWEYHYRGSSNVNGTRNIDGDTQYLVGSVSKLITDLLVLRASSGACIDLHTPITEYLPELSNKTSIISWNDITLASLADHLSGIPPNYGFSDFYFLNPLLVSLGFPELSPDDYPGCGVEGLNKGCTKKQLLDGLLTAHPITSPYNRPAYSSLAFTLISYALSAEYNKTYGELLDEYVIEPLGLTNTGESPGNSSRAVIPPGESTWGSNYGDNAPGGGLYSSLNDLSQIITRILNKSILGTETQVHEWLKPHSSTSSPKSLVGRPWEIYRSTNLTPAHPHTIDIYAKNGGAYGYTSQVAIIDQYGIGLALLTAGPADAYRILYDAMLSVFLPAVEEETRNQASHYARNFSTLDGLVSLNTSIDDGPGVKLDALTRNGSDILLALSQFYAQALPQFGNVSTDFRIFPAGVQTGSQLERNSTQTAVVLEDWRVNLDFLPNLEENSGSDLPGQGALKDACVGWQTADWFYYGGEAVDRIVFVKDGKTDTVVGVEVPFLRASLSPAKTEE